MPTEPHARCRQCPAAGGQVVASIPGQDPGHRAQHRARELAEQTGRRHHDHYDPNLDAFLVIQDPQ